MNRKSGFTLAEVLITLGIIGVVATMTIPIVITKYTNAELSSRIKKTYGLVSTAFEDAWDKTGVKDVKNLPLEQLTKGINRTLRVKDLGGRLDYSSVGGIYGLNGEQFTGGALDYSGSTLGGAAYSLPDGSTFGVEKTGSGYTVIIDSNGKKKPNTIGKDIFYFVVKGNNTTLHPYDGACDPNASGILGLGRGCSKKLIENGWEIDW